jgi:hypothetical protein
MGKSLTNSLFKELNVKRIHEIDAFGWQRPPCSDAEREKHRRDKLHGQKEAGYQQLAELCRIGEYEAAKQLANRHPSWGYEIVDGEVSERNS